MLIYLHIYTVAIHRRIHVLMHELEMIHLIILITLYFIYILNMHVCDMARYDIIQNR